MSNSGLFVYIVLVGEMAPIGVMAPVGESESTGVRKKYKNGMISVDLRTGVGEIGPGAISLPRKSKIELLLSCRNDVHVRAFNIHVGTVSAGCHFCIYVCMVAVHTGCQVWRLPTVHSTKHTTYMPHSTPPYTTRNYCCAAACVLYYSAPMGFPWDFHGSCGI